MPITSIKTGELYLSKSAGHPPLVVLPHSANMFFLQGDDVKDSYMKGGSVSGETSLIGYLNNNGYEIHISLCEIFAELPEDVRG